MTREMFNDYLKGKRIDPGVDQKTWDALPGPKRDP
jgi:hypothetical protein